MNFPTTTKTKCASRSLTPSDKVHAIERIHNGETKASVSRDIGVPESTIRGWCKNEYKLRFMAYQSAEAENTRGESLYDKFYGNSTMFDGPSEKRQRLDYSAPLNFSNGFKRAPLACLDFDTNKALTELSTNNGFNPENGAFNGYLSQSSLVNFNKHTSNYNFLAQLNSGLPAVSGLNASNTNTVDEQSDPYIEKWTQQKHSTPSSSNYSSLALDLSQNELKNQLKLKNSINPLMQTQLYESLPLLPALPEDDLYNSIMAILNVNNHYPPLQLPISSSTPKQSIYTRSTAPIIPLPPFPLSTPSSSFIDKNASWFNCPIPLGSNGDLRGSKQQFNDSRFSVADCKDILDNLLNNINNDNGNDYDTRYDSSLAFNKSVGKYNDTDDFSHNNDQNSPKTDDIQVMNYSKPYYNEVEVDANFKEAIKHGEIFLQWLEKSNSPRVTTNQLMQLRFLVSSLKTDLDPKTIHKDSTRPRTNLSADVEDSPKEFKSLEICHQLPLQLESVQNNNKNIEIIDVDGYKMKDESFVPF